MKSGQSGLVVMTILGLVLGLGACKDNKAFCEIVTDCESGQACTDNQCVDVQPGEPDAAPDATPACPEATHQCLPVAPADWSGPTIRADIGVEDPPPACAMEEGGLAAGAGFEANAGSCECSCTTAASITCDPAMIASRPEAMFGCGINLGDPPPEEVPANSCVVISSAVRGHANTHFQLSSGNISGGSCVQGSLSEDLPPTSFDESIALCSAQSALGDCADDFICSPITTGFQEQTCIFQEGLHDCPVDSVYSEQIVAYKSLADSRDCDSCNCNLPPAGSRCAGSFDSFQDSSCQTAGYSPTSGCSLKANWVASTHVRYTPSPADVDCTPAVANPDLLGEVSGVDPVTVCCTAPDQ